MFINTVAVFIYEYDAYGQYLKFVLENPKFEIFLVPTQYSEDIPYTKEFCKIFTRPLVLIRTEKLWNTRPGMVFPNTYILGIHLHLIRRDHSQALAYIIV